MARSHRSDLNGFRVTSPAAQAARRVGCGWSRGEGGGRGGNAHLGVVLDAVAVGEEPPLRCAAAVLLSPDHSKP